MDLKRQAICGVEELQQEWKTGLRMVATEQLRPARRDQLAQRHAGQRTDGDHALLIRTIDDLPAFGVVVARRQ